MRRETAIRVTPLHIALARDRPTGHLDPCEEALVPECGGHGNESPQHINAAALNQRRACDQAIVSTLAKPAPHRAAITRCVSSGRSRAGRVTR